MRWFTSSSRYPSALTGLLFLIAAACGGMPVSHPTAPTLTSASPADHATGVSLNAKLTAFFDTAVSPLSSTSFILMQGHTTVSGVVATSADGTRATFAPSANLAPGAAFIATITTEATSLDGVAFASAASWTFTTGTTTSAGPEPVELGASGNFALLAKTAISTVPSSTVTGNVGLGPAAASYFTGFSLVADATNVFSSSPQIVGKAYAANYAVPTPANLTTAVADMETAYTDAAGRPTPDHLELGSGILGGLTLAPGLYKWTSAITIPTDVTIAGGANDTWIFQTTGDLNISAAQHVTLSGGAQAKNIVWQVAGHATFGANSHFEGVVLCKTDVTLETGASMNGRILAQTQVALQQATLTQP